ncbi:MAG: IS1380 family transposase, partial [Chloroflexota bacterium]
MTHTLADLVAQRIFGLACGYADGNDADRLAEDPIQKLLLDRDPIRGQALASQPTLSRFENAVGPRALYQMGRELAATVIDRHRQRLSGRARRITIDLDVTDDPTHGAQQLSFFHGHYDTWCYLPLLAFVTFNDEADAYLCAAVLRPGNAASAAGAEGVLRAIYTLIRSAFPHTTVRVRLDGGFATPALIDYLDRIGVEYVVAMAENAVLARRAEAQMVDVRAAVAATGAPAQVYGDTVYAARSWAHDRRVIGLLPCRRGGLVRFAGDLPDDRLGRRAHTVRALDRAEDLRLHGHNGPHRTPGRDPHIIQRKDVQRIGHRDDETAGFQDQRQRATLSGHGLGHEAHCFRIDAL